MYYLLKNHDFQVGNTLTLKTNFGGANLVAWSKSLCPDPQKVYNFNVKSEEKNASNFVHVSFKLKHTDFGEIFWGSNTQNVCEIFFFFF